MAYPKPLIASKQACLDYIDLFLEQVEIERGRFAAENRRIGCPITAAWHEVGSGSLFEAMRRDLGIVRKSLAAYGPDTLPVTEDPTDAD